MENVANKIGPRINNINNNIVIILVPTHFQRGRSVHETKLAHWWFRITLREITICEMKKMSTPPLNPSSVHKSWTSDVIIIYVAQTVFFFATWAVYYTIKLTYWLILLLTYAWLIFWIIIVQTIIKIKMIPTCV